MKQKLNAREKEPIARGDAQRIIEEATAYKDRVVLDAQGGSGTFTTSST